MADLRTSLTSELSRIKDDIGDLHDKINAVKDNASTEKVALITQLNQEFGAINRRMNDFAMALQQLMGNAEHNEQNLGLRLQQMSVELDRKLANIKLGIARAIPSNKFQEIDNALTEIREFIEGVETEFRTFLGTHDTNHSKCSEAATALDNRLTAYVRKHHAAHETATAQQKTVIDDAIRTALVGPLRRISELELTNASQNKKLNALNRTVKHLTMKVGAGVAIIGWILNMAFGDSAKDVIAKAMSPKARAVVTQAQKQQAPIAVDGTGTVKDTSPAPAGHPR
jgi:hypothetical protein